MDDLLHPIERNVHTYLTSSVTKELVEVLAKLSLVRPSDPYLFIAQEFLARSPQASDYTIVSTVARPGTSGSETFSCKSEPSLGGASRAGTAPSLGGAGGGLAHDSGRHDISGGGGVTLPALAVAADRPISTGTWTDATSLPPTSR